MTVSRPSPSSHPAFFSSSLRAGCSRALLVAVLSLGGIPWTGLPADQPGKSLPYASRLPDFTLPNPFDDRIRDEDLVRQGLVLVVTAPTRDNRAEQEAWGRLLQDTRRPGPSLVFLQDMDAAAWERLARRKMKRRDEPDSEPILLLDEEGKIRDALGVKPGHTVVLVYRSDRELVHAETGFPTRERARAIWNALD